MRNKVAILYICTGQYVVFWKDFYESFEKYFLKHSLVEYYVFTDAQKLYDEEENARIHRIYQKDLGWPDSTLFRFEMFRSIKEQLLNHDYLFFINSNIICLKEVTEEMFLPVMENILVVRHPGWYGKAPYELPYDRNKKSSAYMSRYSGKVYVCGGVNGGKTRDYFELIEVLAERIKSDYEKGVIAIWHDESHLNKYISEYKSYKVLSPAFCYPEGWEIPFEKILFVRDKKNYITLDSSKQKQQFKAGGRVQRIKLKVSNMIWKMIYCIFAQDRI